MYGRDVALKLDLHHYETVLAIVEHGTMTAAADELDASQSALSHRLAEAERRLGTRLFERGARRRLMPTRAGLVIHQVASRVLADLERSEALVLADDESITAIVRIAVASYDCYHWYPDLLRETRARHPEIDLDLVVVGDDPGAALSARTVDLVITPGEPSGAVTSRFLFDDELVVVVGPNHPLADRRWIGADELSDEVYLTYNSAPAPGFEYDRFIRPSGTYPRLVTVVEQTSAITELVAAGAGLSILSRWALSPALDSGRIMAVSCGPDGLSLPWNAALRMEEPVGSPARTVAELLAQRLQVTALRH